jgi:hypothetical protein
VLGVLDIADEVEHLHRVQLQLTAPANAPTPTCHTDISRQDIVTVRLHARGRRDSRAGRSTRATRHAVRERRRTTSSQTSSSSSSSALACRTLALVSNTTGLLLSPEKSIPTMSSPFPPPSACPPPCCRPSPRALLVFPGTSNLLHNRRHCHWREARQGVDGENGTGAPSSSLHGEQAL